MAEILFVLSIRLLGESHMLHHFTHFHSIASGKGLFLLISVLDYSSSTSCSFINLGHKLEIGLKENREFYTGNSQNRKPPR